MEGYRSIGGEEELPRGTRRVVAGATRAVEILVVSLEGGIFAVDNVCRCVPFVVGHPRPGEDADPATHGGKLARLAAATIDGHRICCPRHGSVYDLRDGRPVAGGAEIGLNTYPVRLHEGVFEVSLQSTAERRQAGAAS